MKHVVNIQGTHLMPRRVVLVLLALIGLILPLSAGAPDDKEVALFNGNDFTGWKKYSTDKNANLDEAFTVDAAGKHIVIKGKPAGYIVTEQEYGNYELTLQWRWGDATARAGSRNSGVLLHVSGPDKIWPKSAEAQLQEGQAGDFWLIEGFKLSADKARQDPRSARHFFRVGKGEAIEKPIGEWNTYVITCKGDTIRLSINGREVNSGEASEFQKGKIAIQSEGAEIHVRNIKLKMLD
jgi:hypothetical protein